MDKNHKGHRENDLNHAAKVNDQAATEGVDLSDVEPFEETSPEEAQVITDEQQEIETLKNLLQQKADEVEKEKKEYLFLMAEFDNFRKRTVRERADLIKSASEKVLAGLLPIVDDFERGLDATRDIENADAVREGMQLIYNKLIKYLADNGVKAIESTDADFDTEIHEAVAMVPADDTTPKGKVKDTVLKGYTLNDKVLRHAKVVVAQ